MASLLLRTVSAQTCFYPDGLTTSNDIPCNSNAEASSCCPTGSFCMDNGLCFGGGVVSRASCTDQAWTSTECAHYCTDGESKFSPTNVTFLTICFSERIECYRLDSLRRKPTDIWLWLEWQSVSKHALNIYYGRRKCSGSTSSTNPSACVQLLDLRQCKQPSIWCRINDRSRFGRRTSTGFLFAHGSLGSEEGETEICSSVHFRTALGTNGSS
jgi:hypothetical protein